jgi:DNA mismatch repair protein MutS
LHDIIKVRDETKEEQLMEVVMAEYTPMMQQYLEIKAQYPDCLLFFRLGDFYEMFLNDAEEASRLLEITLTGRDAGQAGRVPMCGVPYHAAESYIAKLIVYGKKVAICEQVEDPQAAKGLVRREVIRVVTPGSLLESSMLDSADSNYLAALIQVGDKYGLSLVELSTGEVLLGKYQGSDTPARLVDDYLRLQPAEVILNSVAADNPGVMRLLPLAGTKSHTVLQPEETDNPETEAAIARQYPAWSSSEPNFGLDTRALGMALAYLTKMQRIELPHLKQPRCLGETQAMRLDLATRRNLELTKGNRSAGVEGSLLSVLDRTVTALGARELKRWINEPLCSLPDINLRLGAVEELAEQNLARDQLRSLLRGAYDLDRLASRVATGLANARDLLALCRTLQLLPAILELLAPLQAPMLFQLASEFKLLSELTGELERAIQPEPPVSLREGGIFRPGYNDHLDAIQTAAEEGKAWLADLEVRERERTGIRSLKVGFNKVFGYYLEVTKSNLSQVPPDYVRKQTLANAERYITDGLKAREDAILGAEERQKALEYELFIALRQRVAAYVRDIQADAALLAGLDCLQSLAEVAVRERYSKPVLTTDGSLQIVAGRHPVVEQVVGRSNFVPNDLTMQNGELLVITGPNMGGKSTFMRQVALIVLMAQLGSFVPAASAHIGLVDRIFTRVGAADDLFSGQSTFMVEMMESRTALIEATEQSLILFDELGRGTSTYDGMAIAEAIIEYVHERLRAKTLFSTHYHELTALADRLPQVRNLCCQVAEQRGELIFLRTVNEGRADKSYGVNVAKMAGLPTPVIQRARQILRRLEQRAPAEVGALQLTLGDFMLEELQMEVAAGKAGPTAAEEEVLQALRRVEIDALTPLAALNLLAKWKQQLD